MPPVAISPASETRANGSPFDAEQVRAAYTTARDDLLAERNAGGWWCGELASSALSTATAISALAIHARQAPADSSAHGDLISRGVRYLIAQQNLDGGWGDTDLNSSNIATTMLARAALTLAGVVAEHAEVVRRAEEYIAAQGGVAGLRARYGRDKTFAVPILANCALAGLVSWRDVPPLPFELACLPRGLFRFLRLPVVSYAIPALVAIGQARFFHRRPWNPVRRWWRQASVAKSLALVEAMQPASGGFLEATPLTSFVVMSLASIGRAEHPIVRRGVEFLARSIRADGSWPIDTNLATWNTTLAINALAAADDPADVGGGLDWLLSCQHNVEHPYTATPPGGWGWSDLSGAVPDVDDTSGALLAVKRLAPAATEAQRASIDRAAAAGVAWLLDLQNRNGGWPTFCRGWGLLPFDRSGTDLTAHAVRALIAWLPDGDGLAGDSPLRRRMTTAIERGFDYLAHWQHDDGRWEPLWFGNQYHPQEANPVYGTARVLLAYRDAERLAAPAARRGMGWLVSAQNDDGGWGNASAGRLAGQVSVGSGVEETALAVESLLAGGDDPWLQPAVRKGLTWLCTAVASDHHRQPAPLGFYFAKLWYYERLYPLTFTVGALGQAMRRLSPCSARPADVHPPARTSPSIV